jgi:hypothetical protein
MAFKADETTQYRQRATGIILSGKEWNALMWEWSIPAEEIEVHHEFLTEVVWITTVDAWMEV